MSFSVSVFLEISVEFVLVFQVKKNFFDGRVIFNCFVLSCPNNSVITPVC